MNMLAMTREIGGDDFKSCVEALSEWVKILTATGKAMECNDLGHTPCVSLIGQICDRLMFFSY